MGIIQKTQQSQSLNREHTGNALIFILQINVLYVTRCIMMSIKPSEKLSDMFYLLIPAIAFIFAVIPHNAFLNLLGHYTLKLTWIGILLAAAGCLVAPLFVKMYDSGGMIIFLAPILAIVAIIPYFMEKIALSVRETRKMTPQEKWEYVQEKHDETTKMLQEEITEKSKKADKFFISSVKRRELRKDIAHAKLLRAGMNIMVDSYKEKYGAEINVEENSSDKSFSEENFHPSLRRNPKPPSSQF